MSFLWNYLVCECVCGVGVHAHTCTPCCAEWWIENEGVKTTIFNHFMSLHNSRLLFWLTLALTYLGWQSVREWPRQILTRAIMSQNKNIQHRKTSTKDKRLTFWDKIVFAFWKWTISNYMISAKEARKLKKNQKVLVV